MSAPRLTDSGMANLVSDRHMALDTFIRRNLLHSAMVRSIQECWLQLADVGAQALVAVISFVSACELLVRYGLPGSHARRTNRSLIRDVLAQRRLGSVTFQKLADRGRPLEQRMQVSNAIHRLPFSAVCSALDPATSSPNSSPKRIPRSPVQLIGNQVQPNLPDPMPSRQHAKQLSLSHFGLKRQRSQLSASEQVAQPQPSIMSDSGKPCLVQGNGEGPRVRRIPFLESIASWKLSFKRKRKASADPPSVAGEAAHTATASKADRMSRQASLPAMWGTGATVELDTNLRSVSSAPILHRKDSASFASSFLSNRLRKHASKGDAEESGSDEQACTGQPMHKRSLSLAEKLRSGFLRAYFDDDSRDATEEDHESSQFSFRAPHVVRVADSEAESDSEDDAKKGLLSVAVTAVVRGVDSLSVDEVASEEKRLSRDSTNPSMTSLKSVATSTTSSERARLLEELLQEQGYTVHGLYTLTHNKLATHDRPLSQQVRLSNAICLIFPDEAALSPDNLRVYKQFATRKKRRKEQVAVNVYEMPWTLALEMEAVLRGPPPMPVEVEVLV
ncbi:hypothetical protein BC830DRAFT_1175203 [Chytriomyces sp. MP71]|nr:hypothetical protein BC830DRAFT_1175203 [Chytriomyces sp. MP71]